MIAIETKQLHLGYSDRVILKDISLAVEQGSFVTIIGANGSGKSTLLKGMSRLLKPLSGQVELFGQNLSDMSNKEIAARMAILPQIHNAQPDMTLERLVAYGRHPHLSWRRRFSQEDQAVIDWAIEATNLTKLRHRLMGQLSGGESQRAWLAMALAQQPQVLFLDEPTTYLDLAHQLEILETIKELNQAHGITVIMVHHDLNQAVRYSDTIVALKDGRIGYHVPSRAMMDPVKIETIFSVQGEIYCDDDKQCHFFIPEKNTRSRVEIQ